MPMNQYSEDPETRGLVRIPDHDTSVAAAKSVPATRSRMKATIYRLLDQGGPQTDEELTRTLHALGIHAAYSSAGKRRGDLVAEGLVMDSGIRRPNSNGRNMIAWRVVDLLDLADQKPAPTGGFIPEHITDRIDGHEGDQP